MSRNHRQSITRVAASLAIGLSGVAAVATAASAQPGNGAGGATGPAFYVDGELYRTVGTPTDFTNTGAPESSFDVIYSLPGVRNVATAAPGDRDFNGGRWRVHAISFDDFDVALTAADANGSGSFDSAEEVEAAIDMGLAHDDGVVQSFQCPVIPTRA